MTPPEWRERTERALAEVMQTGTVQPFESEMFRKDGTRVPVLLAGALFEEGGNEGVGFALDLSEQKQAEEALRRSQNYLAEAQMATHTGSCALDGNSREIRYWSEEMFRIYGFDSRQGLPTWDQWMQRIHPEDLNKFRMAGDKTFLEKVHCDVEFRIVIPNGTVKHIHAIGHPLLSPNGELVQVVGTMVDISERKRAEQDRERLRELQADLAHMNRVSMMGELAASITHELNQPLSGVVVNGNACLRWLAGDSPNFEEARENARRIVRDGKRAGDIIARIRGQATKTATAMARLDMNETIQEVIALAQTEVRRNSVTLHTELAKDLSPVLGDRVQLQQVVLNLVMNAVDAMSTVGGRPRQLVIRTQNDEADLVRITLQDSGIGLDPQSVERIFDAFYTTKSGGMGMGLSISRSIVQNHGGRLWAVANEGPGTTLQFTVQKYEVAARNSVAGA
jgi:PAS domain S-box-containing protein